MEKVILKIRERYSQMSRAEKKISDFILSHGAECLEMTALDIAEKSEVSSASVIRYVQKLGYDGLDSFKLALASSGPLENEWKIQDLIISPEDSIDELCGKMKQMTETSLQDFFYQLDKKTMESAIEALKSARRIYTLGIGASMLPAYDLYHKLKRADFDATFSMDINMVMEFFNYLDERDVVVAFSYSGQSKEVICACEAAKQQNVTVLAVTRNSSSRLRELADISLLVPNKEHVMRIGAFTSTFTSMMMADILYLGVIQENLKTIEIELVKTRKLVEGMKVKD